MGRAEVADHNVRPGGADAGEHRAHDALQRTGLEQPAGDQAAAKTRPGATANRGPEHRLLEPDRRNDRQQHPQLAALAIDLRAEFAAPRTFAQVPAQVRTPQRAAAEVRELFADLRAVGLARSATRNQRLAGLEHERLHLVLGDPEHIADLLVAERVHLRQDERGALLVG